MKASLIREPTAFMRIFSAILILAILAFILPLRAGAEQAADAGAPCTPAARLFGETLCREKLGMKDVTGDPDTQENKQIVFQNRQLLHNALWNRALLEKFDAKTVTPLEADVTAFRAEISDAMRQRYEADKQTVAYIAALLDRNHYRPEDERRLRELAQDSALSARFYEEQESRRAELPPEYGFIGEETERQVALGLLGGWKADKALLGAYGGRLVRTPEGLTPVDARRAFVRYMRKDGRLSIADPALKDVFAAEETPLKKTEKGKGPEIVAPGSALYKAFLADPAWRFHREDPGARMASLEKWIASLPLADGTAPDTP